MFSLSQYCLGISWASFMAPAAPENIGSSTILTWMEPKSFSTALSASPRPPIWLPSPAHHAFLLDRP